MSLNVRYLCDPEEILVDLPSDVLKRLSKTIDQDFISQAKAITFQELKLEKGRYNIYDALYLLGDKEGWNVERLVPILIDMNNTAALKILLKFWPAKILQPPPEEFYVDFSSPLDVFVTVNGFPEPTVEWRNYRNETVATGPHLRLNPSEIDLGHYTVIASNYDKSDKSRCPKVFNDSAMFIVRQQPNFSSRAWEPPLLIEERHRQASPPVKQAAATVPIELRGYTPLDLRPLPPSPPSALGKIALLIGLGNYSAYSRLEGPSHDLPKLAHCLAKAEFRVVTLLDLDYNDLNMAIDIYFNLLQPGVYGVLYLSGHGVRFPKVDDDYLIPVDAPLNCEPFQCLSRQTLISRLQKRSPALNFVIWDACRSPTSREDAWQPTQRDFYTEHNLFEFRSSIAYMYSYDTQKGSVIMMPFLEILGDMGQKYPMDELLMKWKRAVEERKLQMPSILIGGQCNLSLWDPVMRRVGQTAIYYRILQLWCENQEFDELGVFPKLHITCSVKDVSIHTKFLVHNVLQLSIFSRCPDRVVGFDLHEMKKWKCSVFSQDDDSPHECPKRIIIRDLQKIAHARSSCDRNRMADAVNLPCLIRPNSKFGYKLFHCTIEHIRLIQLFRTERNIIDRG